MNSIRVRNTYTPTGTGTAHTVLYVVGVLSSSAGTGAADPFCIHSCRVVTSQQVQLTHWLLLYSCWVESLSNRLFRCRFPNLLSRDREIGEKTLENNSQSFPLAPLLFPCPPFSSSFIISKFELPAHINQWMNWCGKFDFLCQLCDPKKGLIGPYNYSEMVKNNHRRRIELEDKAKVVASVWGTQFIQFLAALAILPWSIEKKRNWINLAPQAAVTTFAFSSVSILLLGE